VFENIGKTVAKVIEESLETLEQAVGRVSTTVLSVRISDEDLRIIDSLVEGGVFRSRSEAVAFFTHRGIECSKDWIEKVKDKLEEIRKLQREIRSEIDLQFNRKSS
jgi:Arc/MetJ-type ribon-helix-helix transcriptional regulator